MKTLRLMSAFTWHSIIFSSLVILTSITTALGQTSSSAPPEQQRQMEKLDFLIGEWKGKGGRCRPDGSCGTVEISQAVKVKKGKGGLTLIISDRKRYPDLKIAGGFPGSIQSHPIEMSGTATIQYDEGEKQYIGRFQPPGGRKHPLAARLLEPTVLQIKVDLVRSDLPSLPMIVTIKLTENGDWHESLYFWLGEQGWTKMQETLLKKVK